MGQLRRKTKKELFMGGVTIEDLEKLERVEISNKGFEVLQKILHDLAKKVNEYREEIVSLKEDNRAKDETLQTQHRHIVRLNEEIDRPENLSRDEKVWRLRAQGMSQQEIAEHMGLTRARINQILRSVKPLNTLGDDWVALGIKTGVILNGERDAKICEWREQGHSQEQLAEITGLSRGRIAQIVLEKCTKVQKANIQNEKILEKAKKNKIHRNTQARIEQIRKVAPKLAEKAENGGISVNKAYNQVLDDLVRLGIK